MKHIAAYLLLQIGGNTSPSAKDIKKVLGAVGIDADDDRLETLLSELSGKDVNELIAEGSSKLASVPSGGGGGGGGAVAVSGGGGGAAAAAAEEKKEEKEEEKVCFFVFVLFLFLFMLLSFYRRSRMTIWALVFSIKVDPHWLDITCCDISVTHSHLPSESMCWISRNYHIVQVLH